MASLHLGCCCFILYALAFNSSISFSTTLASADQCVLNISLSSTRNSKNCTSGSWGGFLDNECCASPFQDYLLASARWANQSGRLFLNPTQQKECLSSMRSSNGNLQSCGIEKLISGAGGCSEFSLSDVMSSFKEELRSFDQDCRLLGSDGGSAESCSPCLRRWREMSSISNNTNDSGHAEADICRFAILIASASQRNDERWVQDVSVCLGESSLSTDDGGQRVGKSAEYRKDLYVLLGGIAGIAVIIAIVSWMSFRKSTEGNVARVKEASIRSVSEDQSFESLCVKQVYSATNNLSQSNFIGQGIAGKVYKGILSDGRHVAIKHIINDGQMETFVREVTSMSHVKHPNLVELLGHCEGEHECFLVYEMCHNGNLSEWIFGKDKVLSWIQRLVVAIDCARGLWFLHTYPEGCIIHRDIKPTNILICADFQAKLSDFGLSKVLNLDQSYVSSEVRGTFGYVDPEYRKNRRVNAGGDVYSFGIVLLQVLSGQRVVNIDLTRPMPLDKMAKMLTRTGNITDFADPKLKGEYSVEAFEDVFKLALSCTGLKRLRPSMEQVVVRLEKALDISTGSESFHSCSIPSMSR